MKRMKFDDFYTIFIYKNTESFIGKTKTISVQTIFDDKTISPKCATEYFQHIPKKKKTIEVFFKNKRTGEPITIGDMNERLKKLDLKNKPLNGEETLSKIKEFYFDEEFLQKLSCENDSITCLSLLIFDIYEHYLEARNDLSDVLKSNNQAYQYPIEKLPFLEIVNSDVDSRTNIYFAFHYGMHFFIEPRENELLRDNLINRKAHLKMIINSVHENSITPELIKNIRNRNLKYFQPLDCLQYWLEFMNDVNSISCDKSIEIRVCKLPLMHKIHLFFKDKGSETTWGAANISYYCYGDKNLENNHVYTHDDQQFKNLKIEFEYLFDISVPLKDYLDNLKQLNGSNLLFDVKLR